jgi:2Fe-2S ferredoxin
VPVPSVTFIQSDGSTQSLVASEGWSVMQTATQAGVRGIVAECGGSAMCATCHVYVDTAWLAKLNAPLANELEMLECTAAERLDSSRLSCQIKMSALLDGLIVRVPDRQQ